MPSYAKPTFETWNRRLHYYLGLVSLFFLWLFSLTGLLLNHGSWALAQAADERRETRYEQAIRPPAGASDLERARDVMSQLKLVGEIEWPGQTQPGRLGFTVARPRDSNQVRVDLAQNRAAVQRFDNGGWGVFRNLHTFSGSRVNVASSQRDWVLTTVWVLAMDALAAALVVMVLGSYYMWYRLKPKRRIGLTALAAGTLSCGVLLAGLL